MQNSACQTCRSEETVYDDVYVSNCNVPVQPLNPGEETQMTVTVTNERSDTVYVDVEVHVGGFMRGRTEERTVSPGDVKLTMWVEAPEESGEYGIDGRVVSAYQ